jgi:uncharacterized protein (TIGR00375 family)
MKSVYADLHYHSPYSRAVSPKMTLENLVKWGELKGTNLITTADFTHPKWFKNLKENLTESRQGIYQLKKNTNSSKAVDFLITTEISLIYNSHKIHLLIWVPNLKTAEKINNKFKELDLNLEADGRPIFGLTAPELLEILLKINKKIIVIPAHIWTPWFALFGSKSGFKSLKACFKDYSNKIYGIETGLSSDPAMNWQIKELDNRRILSFSDAHSLPKLGREVTEFNLPNKFTFEDILTSLKTPYQNKDKNKPYIKQTIEFYPQEGKYHHTGHRKCNVSHTPKQTKKLGTTCPVCGRSLTIGVAHQVEKHARDKKITPKAKVEKGIKKHFHPDNLHPPYINLIPLNEIIAEAEDVGVKTKTVKTIYDQAIQEFDNELNILIKAPIDKLSKELGPKITQGIKRNREGNVNIVPGFDGRYGKVKIWEENEKLQVQKGLF